MGKFFVPQHCRTPDMRRNPQIQCVCVGVHSLATIVFCAFPTANIVHPKLDFKLSRPRRNKNQICVIVTLTQKAYGRKKPKKREQEEEHLITFKEIPGEKNNETLLLICESFEFSLSFAVITTRIFFYEQRKQPNEGKKGTSEG